jgi:hypothetical protein
MASLVETCFVTGLKPGENEIVTTTQSGPLPGYYFEKRSFRQMKNGDEKFEENENDQSAILHA